LSEIEALPPINEVFEEEDKPLQKLMISYSHAMSTYILLLISFWLKYWGQFGHLFTKIILGNIKLGNIYLPIYVTYSKVHKIY